MSLRTRLLILALLASLLPTLLVALRFLRDSEAEVDAAVQSLSAEAANLASELENRVQGTAQLHYGLAHARVLESPDRAVCSAYLAAVRETYPQYTGLVSVKPDGELFCNSIAGNQRMNLRDRGYFKQVVAGAEGLVLEPVFGRLTGNAVLQIVFPVRRSGGELSYMLVASLNLLQLAQNQLKAMLAPLPELVLLDRQGLVMVWVGQGAAAHPPGTTVAGTPMFDWVQQQARGGTGEITDGQGRVKVWAVASTEITQRAGLHVLVGQARTELVANSRGRLRQDLLTLAGLASLLFAGVWLLAEVGIRRPVERITTMVRAMGTGDLGARIAKPYPRGELGGLMAALNSSAASLQQQRQAIDELGQQLRQAQKLEAIGTLAGGIAHDFNNVLGAILGNVSLAHEEAQAGRPTQQHLAQIRRAALRARTLVQGIQAFGRAGAPAPSVQPLQAVVEEVMALVRVSVPGGVSLRTEIDPRPMDVLADATRLHQVLLNLCTNAWQALQGEPGTVTIGLKAMCFEPHDAERPPGLAAGRYAHLWVSDTGCGIDAATREHLFEPFFTTRQAQGGTGLGLSMVHGIVTGLNGHIAVHSSPGQGSRFDIYLPLHDQPAPATSDEAGPAMALAAAPGRGQRILYLDDDEVMVLMVEGLLARAGYQPTCHTSAEAALAAVSAEPGAYDLVVTDFNMPELSGLEVGRQLAALRPDLPVLMISGYIFDALPAQARRAGVREVIRKQHVLEELVPAIARILNGR